MALEALAWSGAEKSSVYVCACEESEIMLFTCYSHVTGMVISDEVKLIISVDDKIAWWWKNRFFGEIGVVYYGRCVEGMQPDERSSQSSMWVVVVLLRS